jgi:DNA-binding helix-hairpin-helix protein with protein kinase domain
MDRTWPLLGRYTTAVADRLHSQAWGWSNTLNGYYDSSTLTYALVPTSVQDGIRAWAVDVETFVRDQERLAPVAPSIPPKGTASSASVLVLKPKPEGGIGTMGLVVIGLLTAVGAFVLMRRSGAALGETEEEDIESLRDRLNRERELARRLRRQEDKLRAEVQQRESLSEEIRRIAPESGRKPDRGGKKELRTAKVIAARETVRKSIAEVRRAINKKSMGAARVALRQLKSAVSELDPSDDAEMVKTAKRVIEVARSRGLQSVRSR